MLSMIAAILTFGYKNPWGKKLFSSLGQAPVLKRIYLLKKR
jgi:hypothetical protein